MDHTLQAELARALVAVGRDVRVSPKVMQPGDDALIDLSAESIYVHVPTPDGVIGLNITEVRVQRPVG